MADLLTHVLTAYILATLLSWRVEWLTPPLVTLTMVGAAVPDLNRVDLVLPDQVIEATLGIPFDWEPSIRSAAPWSWLPSPRWSSRLATGAG